MYKQYFSQSKLLDQEGNKYNLDVEPKIVLQLRKKDNYKERCINFDGAKKFKCFFILTTNSFPCPNNRICNEGSDYIYYLL